jgi:Zn-dependent protease/CBS domain-containing protein
MGNSFQIGKIFGISIRIDYTWFVVFALVALSLASYFPKVYANRSTVTYWVMGVITALIFFGCVLAHELAHSMVSKARGVPVQSITLFIFGGVARISDEPKSPGSEFWMALAGPATSVGISAIFGALYLATVAIGRSRTPFAALAAWLSGINLLLAALNLVPGFPLDGGRILRSIIWKITGDLKKSTRIASRLGRIVAYIFILLGVFRAVVYRDLIGGIWAAFIGWFLENAASSSYRQLALREMLQGAKVSEVMTTDCPRLPKGLTIKELLNGYILRTTYRCFPVVDNGHVLGIISLHSVEEIPHEQWETMRVEEAMTPLDQLRTVHPDDDLYTAMREMTEEGVNQLPVMEDNQLLGMVARDNLMSFINARSESGA